MTKALKGKIAMITGASSGIGWATAEVLGTPVSYTHLRAHETGA